MQQTDWTQLATQIITPILLALISAFGVLLIAFTKAATTYLQDRLTIGQSSASKDLMDKLIVLASQKVLAAEQTAMETLKSEVATGKLNKDNIPAELVRIKQSTVDAVRRDANAQGFWADAQKLFQGNEAALVAWLSDVIEGEVHKLPPSGLQS